MSSGFRRGQTGVITRRPEGTVDWTAFEKEGYKIKCLAPFKRFRGTQIPWESPLELNTTTEFVAKVSRSRRVVKLSAGQYGAPIEVYVKRYNYKTWYGPYLRITRRSRAQHEFDLGWKLMELGIRTPRPVWLAEAAGALSPFSLLATEAIPGSENAIQRWHRLDTEVERRDLLLALGRFILSLHEHKLYHDDCKAEHVLVLPGAPSSPSEFFIIDLLGCELQRRLSKLARAKNLYQILRSFLPKKGEYGFTPDHRAVFLQAYAGSLAEAAEWSKWVDRVGRMKGRVV
ncbi:MAG: hypothetical protein AMXMBFR7_15480 [Planctomycetota bacterium]